MTQEDIILNIMEEPCKEIGNAISQPIKAIKYFILGVPSGKRGFPTLRKLKN